MANGTQNKINSKFKEERDGLVHEIVKKFLNLILENLGIILLVVSSISLFFLLIITYIYLSFYSKEEILHHVKFAVPYILTYMAGLITKKIVKRG